MNDFLIGLKEGILATSSLEWIAVLTGIAYVILAARKSILCWPFAFLSAGIYVYLCYSAQLFIESSLQLFYVVMAVVGWVMWNQSKEDKQFVKTWPVKFHLANVLISLIVAFVLGWMFQKYTAQENPYVDAFTTVFSLAATFMVTKKLLYNWLYWIIIDLVSIYLYASRGFHLSSVLYFIFTILAVVGFVQWRKQFRLQTR